MGDATGGACASPMVASSGQRHLAAWRAGSLFRVALFDGTRWTAPQSLATNAYYGGLSVASRPGQLGVAWSTGSGVSFRASDGTETGWGTTTTLDASYTSDAPQVIGGAGGFAVAWLHNGLDAYAAVLGAAHGGSQWLGSGSGGYASGVTMVPNGNGFVALVTRSSSGSVDAYGFAEPVGWQWTTVMSGATTLRAAAGARGLAFVFRDGAGTLRGATLVDGRWTGLEPFRTGVAGTPALAWDGESYVLGWTEPDPLDATIDRVFTRRGL
jgi:hypothetical protein